MFQIAITATPAPAVPVLFSKFFAASDSEAALAAVTSAKRVVFIDTPATQYLVAAVEALFARGVEVVVRDHHDVTDVETAKGGRPAETRAAVERLRALLGANALISNRASNPACSSLIVAGEFAGEGTVIVADPDPDGLTAALKGLGVVYSALDEDAAVLDGPRAGQSEATLSPLAWTLTRAMAALPPFDPSRPEVSERAKAALFGTFAAAVGGDQAALARLEADVTAYETGVAEAKKILATATEPVPGVCLVDVVPFGRHDLATLVGGLERRTGCRVTVIRKVFGPVAKACGGVQYSLAVPRPLQQEVNLQALLPAGFTSAPEAGIISNTTFLLHVSEKVWQEVILPAFRGKFGD